jgi:hypothetical protein
MVKWGVVAHYVHTKMITLCPQWEHALEIDDVNMRINLMSKANAPSHHSWLEPKSVTDWFWDRLDYTVEQVEEILSKGWWTLLGSEILDLRRLKQRIGRVRRMIEQGILEPDNNLIRWLELSSRLP